VNEPCHFKFQRDWPASAVSRSQASRMVSDELARWVPIIKATGFKME
jgi:hypothetical protein